MAEGRSWYRSPEVWALLVSLVSVVVSFSSCHQVETQLKLTAGQVKAYVQVVDVALEEPLANTSTIRLRMKLKNCGQTAAIDVRGDMDYDEGMPNVDGESNSATLRKFGPMGPGMEREVRLTSNRMRRSAWPTPHRQCPPLFFYGTVWYTDDTSGERRKEDWCFELPLKTEADLQRTQLERSSLLFFESRDEAPK